MFVASHGKQCPITQESYNKGALARSELITVQKCLLLVTDEIHN